MSELSTKAIQSAKTASVAFCKFIMPNDTGNTGSHQAGYHLHKNSWPLYFNSPGEKGANKDYFVRIKWQDDFYTDSRFIYYGVGTRNEYRLTRFGRGFPYLSDHHIGCLLVICRRDKDEYDAYVLETDDEIEDFLTSLEIPVTQTSTLISKKASLSPEQLLRDCFNQFLKKISGSFPPTIDIASAARDCSIGSAKASTADIVGAPDLHLIKWIETEFMLFKLIESIIYAPNIKAPFPNIDELITFANSILNRRKSRAGKSLEHHLAAMFRYCKLSFDSQGKVEDHKTPDFIFPGLDAYHKKSFPTDKLIFLASKTTCKDRWRQVINEADRIPVKHLFTLQQGVSSNQLAEMKKAGVRLVIPASNLSAFPKEYHGEILSLASFIELVANNRHY